MKSKMAAVVCIVILLMAAAAFGQSDTGKPDSVFIGTIKFAAPPWPTQIEVPVWISSDDNITGWTLGLYPMTPDKAPFTDLRPSAFTHPNSPFNTSTGTPFWTQFRYDAALNVGLFGWADFGAGIVASPFGEMGRLVLDVDNPDIPVGTVVFIDTMSLDNGGFVEMLYKEGSVTQVQPFPWHVDGPDADIVLDVEERLVGTLPTTFSLEQNSPNPFNPETRIDFSIPQSGHVHIQVINTLGQKIKTLVDEQLAVGYKSVTWDGRDDRGKEVASGVYFYRMSVNDFAATKKMLLLK